MQTSPYFLSTDIQNERFSWWHPSLHLVISDYKEIYKTAFYVEVNSLYWNGQSNAYNQTAPVDPLSKWINFNPSMDK